MAAAPSVSGDLRPLPIARHAPGFGVPRSGILIDPFLVRDGSENAKSVTALDTFFDGPVRGSPCYNIDAGCPVAAPSAAAALWNPDAGDECAARAA